MPPERRTSYTPVKPMKTERAHEENQERAYIAASRRSDRSLEARIESARRASEIHKKRTGRALRVTERDVVNEEMYEEEDDDLPTQYQRLNAHLQTSSWLFNRKLQDYIATQQGVRNMFLHQQFPNHMIPQYNTPYQSNGQMPMMNQPMLPPQAFSPTTPNFVQSPQVYTPQAFQQQQQQQNFRQAPYTIPARQNPHQRSASVSAPLAMPNAAGASMQSLKVDVTTPNGETSRRLSLPHNIMPEPQPAADALRPSMSRSPSNMSGKQPLASKEHTLNASSAPSSGPVTPYIKDEHTSPTHYGFPSMPFDPNSQVIDMNPLSLSLPPESQQIVGASLDPQDPRTAILMAGSDNLPQPPFMGTYTYNPNLSPKSARAKGASATLSAMPPNSDMAQTLVPGDFMKQDPSVENPDSNSPPSASMDPMFTSSALYTPTEFDSFNFFDQYPNPDGKANSNGSQNDQTFENQFINWDQ